MLNPERVFRDEVCYLEGSSQDGEVIHAACETNNNGGGRVRRRRRWPEPSQPGPDAGVILTNSTGRDAEAAGHPERTPTRASRPEQKLRAPQTTSVQLKKIPTKTPPICCTSDTCAFLAAISGGSPLRPPPRPSTVLAQILSLPGPEPGLLTGARCGGAQSPAPPQCAPFLTRAASASTCTFKLLAQPLGHPHRFSPSPIECAPYAHAAAHAAVRGDSGTVEAPAAPFPVSSLLPLSEPSGWPFP